METFSKTYTQCGLHNHFPWQNNKSRLGNEGCKFNIDDVKHRQFVLAVVTKCNIKSFIKN